MSMTKRGLVPVAAVAACCCLAACGSSSSTSSSGSSAGGTSTSAGTGARSSAGRAAFVACLKKHGVTLPSRPPGQGGGYGPGGGRPPSGGGDGFAANPKLRAAFQACGGGRFGGGRGGPPTNSTAFRTALTKYTTCVRRHGYNLPKPNLSGNGPVFPSSIRTDSKFQAASKACQGLLARPGGAPPGSASPAA
jgi:hypothetical protein